MLASRIHRLHWWLESFALLFCLYTCVYLTFEMVGILARGGARRQLAAAWIPFLSIAFLSAVIVARFSAFGQEGGP